MSPTERQLRDSVALISVNNLPSETISERVKRLQEEARGLAAQHVKQTQLALAEAEALCREIADGGESYHVGARDECRKLADQIEASRQTIEAVTGRASR